MISVINTIKQVCIGCQITVLYPDGSKCTFMIVSERDAVAPEEGKISPYSPLGSALMGKIEGDTIIYSIKTGITSAKILTII